MINNIGIIGLGSIGRRHLRLVRELRPSLNIIAIRSGKGKKVEEEKLVNSVVYSLKDAMDSGIDTAIIATPAVFHIQQAFDLMKRGIHVLIEKPLSNSLDNINELIRVNKQTNVVALVGYCLRYNSGAMQFHKMLNEEKTGQTLHVQVDCGSYLPDWRQGQDYRNSVSAISELGGGVLLELSHELDYIRWFFGDMKNVYANIHKSNTLDITAEDFVDMIFISNQGFPISLHLDFNSQSIRRNCIARCSGGDLVWDAVNNKVIWRPIAGPEEVKAYENERDYIYMDQLKHFFDCIENNKSPLVSLFDGAAVLSLIKSAKKSNKTGKKVALA